MKIKLISCFCLLLFNNSFAQRIEFKEDDQLNKKVITMADSSICENFYLGNISIIEQCFYPDGNRKSYSTLNSEQTGIYISWYSNGKIEFIENYLFGYLDGPYFAWYESGELKEKGHYYIPKNGSVIDLRELSNIERNIIDNEQGTFEVSTEYKRFLKDGEWFFYNEEGNLIKKEIWNKNQLLQSINY